ncbi:MAG: SurA N-terminal domain-containing protein [Candidatus Omnitrophota bacterium]|nr:SurA N-terminal domain-containing protein [Candidatus Omnitrophota bacterium]
MLKLFRKKFVSRLILWSLLILILPAFVMWGSASMSRSKDKGPTYVGMASGKKVSFDDLYIAMSGVRSQIILNYFNQPQVLEALLTNRPMLAKIAWDRVLLLDEAKKLRIKSSDKEVVEFIRSHPLFLRNGVFDENFYSYMLRNNIGLEPRAFEEIVRDNIIIQKLSAQLTKDIKTTDDDVLSEYKKEFAKIKIAYILMEPKDFLDQAKVDENAAKEFYEKHKSELMLKSNLKGALPDRSATFEESKDTIEKFIKEVEARKILKIKSEELYGKLLERMREKNETFEKAASQLKLTVKNTDFFSRADKIDDIGDIPVVAGIGSELKLFEVSKPVEITKGIIIFEVAQRKDPDEEAFKKEKDEYAKKVQEQKSNTFMEDHLRKLEGAASLAIKLEEIDKYYR